MAKHMMQVRYEMKPFDYYHAMAGTPVICRNGHPAEVTVWDNVPPYSLKGWTGYHGEKTGAKATESQWDLFLKIEDLIPELELALDQGIKDGSYAKAILETDEATEARERTIRMREEAKKNGPHPVETCGCAKCKTALALDEELLGWGDRPFFVYVVKASRNKFEGVNSIKEKRTFRIVAESLDDLADQMDQYSGDGWQYGKIKIYPLD
jgi:hypothetical protein